MNPVLLSETPLTETRIMDRMPFTPPPLSRLVPYLNAGNPTAKFFKGMSQCYVTSEVSSLRRQSKRDELRILHAGSRKAIF